MADIPSKTIPQLQASAGVADGTLFAAYNSPGPASRPSALQLSAYLGNGGLPFLQSGIGAVSRTAQSKMRDTVSVKDFGAVGDGVVDDTAAVQAAINFAITSYCGLYVPYGQYSVTGLTAVLTAVPPVVSFSMFGSSMTGALLIKRGATTNPILTITQSGGAGVANALISGLGFTGNANNADGLVATSLGGVVVSNCQFYNNNTGLNCNGSVASQILECFLNGNNTGIAMKASTSPVTYANANSIENTRINNNKNLGVDFIAGSFLALRGCDIEENGQAGVLTTGGFIVRAGVAAENSTSGLSLYDCWFEANFGRAFQVESTGTPSFVVSLNSVNFLSTEGGHAVFVAGGSGAQYIFQSCLAPGGTDTVSVTAGRLTLLNCSINAIAGTQTNFLQFNTTTAAGTEGNVQSSLWLGNANPLDMTWVNGTAGYRQRPNTVTGAFDFTGLGLVTAPVFNFSGQVKVPIARTPGVLFSALPTAAAAGNGARAYITDCTVTTFGTTAAGGSTNSVPVVSNGTNWTVG